MLLLLLLLLFWQVTTLSLARNINAVRFTSDGTKVSFPNTIPKFSSHQLIHLLLSSLGETSCWSKVSWELDQFIYSPHVSSYTYCYLHWEKQVVHQKFHESLISSYILLTSVHTLIVIFIRRNKLLIKGFMRAWSVHIFFSHQLWIHFLLWGDVHII